MQHASGTRHNRQQRATLRQGEAGVTRRERGLASTSARCAARELLSARPRCDRAPWAAQWVCSARTSSLGASCEPTAAHGEICFEVGEHLDVRPAAGPSSEEAIADRVILVRRLDRVPKPLTGLVHPQLWRRPLSRPSSRRTTRIPRPKRRTREDEGHSHPVRCLCTDSQSNSRNSKA